MNVYPLLLKCYTYMYIYTHTYIVLCYTYSLFYVSLRPKKALKLLGDTKRGSIEWIRFHE